MLKSIYDIDFQVRYFKAANNWVCTTGGLGETIYASGKTPEEALQNCMIRASVYLASKQ
jgi:hypothetical protein